MVRRTLHPEGPWGLGRADDKHQARLNVIRDLLARIPCPEVSRRRARPDPRVAREFDERLLGSGWAAD